MKSAFYYIVAVVLLIFAASSLSISRAQTMDEGQLFAQAQILSGLSLELRGGINQRGRRTLLQSGIVDFGNVSFVDPELMTNGDAFFRGKDLWLEAVIDAKVIFNGATSVDLGINKVATGASEFSQVLYSTGLRQTDESKSIPNAPDSEYLGTVRNSGDSQKFRLLCIVSPTQTGLMIAKVQIGAEKI